MTPERSTRPSSPLVQLTGVSGAQETPLPGPTLNPGASTKAATKRTPVRLRPGDLVRVRPLQEVFRTLGPDGTLEGVPLMPEMWPFFGHTFRILQHVVQACVDGAYLKVHNESYVREFRNNNVFTLVGVRCSGSQHDGCQRGCTIFWKEAWLQKVDEASAETPLDRPSTADVNKFLHSTLKTRSEDGRFYCQSTEFLKATLHLSFSRRLWKCVQSVAVGNVGAAAMLRRITLWMWWKTRHKLFGEHVKGLHGNTPTECLNLQPGELVEVNSLAEIVATLNEKGRNRGLHFSGDQRPFCGRRYRVRSRADNFIAEGTGEMKHFRNTVILEDVLCDSSYFAFGGCCRHDFLYWREAWLRRVEDFNSE